MAERTTHNVLPMGGRDPDEEHRPATPLELLFDLTFVIAFGVAADELAHLLATDHISEGLVGFGFAMFAVSWAWIFWSWFASAFDTDDWVYRLLTLIQMAGVLVLALGLPAMFESLEKGEHIDNRVMVLGYVVMRFSMVLQWWRVSRQSPDRSSTARTMITSIVVSQAIWCWMALADLPTRAFFIIGLFTVAIELLGPVVAERKYAGTPWHPHHIAERYGLLVIITLGEGLLGTMAALAVLIEGGWSTDIVVLGIAGTVLPFGLWWTYFVVPHGHLLAAHRERSFGWGYGQMLLFAGLVAVGAGLHVAAYYLDDHSELGATATVLTVAIPLAVYLIGLYVLYAQITRTMDPFHLLLIAGTVVVLVGAVLLSAAGLGLTWCLLLLSLAPLVTVIGYETVGHRHNEKVLASLTHP
ncbi:MAG TPA: low temperature requirement protein A [Nocardioides sp.]|nr:low temperature requirement protein A [Nocardioides sp.]